MSSTDTTWSPDGNSTASGASSSTTDLSLSGTLSVTGASTLTGAATLSSTLNVTGDVTFDTNTLFVDVSTNRVGIGTTSPQVLLHAYSSASATVKAEIESSGAYDADILFTNTAGSWAVGADGGADAFQIQNVGTSVPMTILATGSVGIGTAAPTGTLHVKYTGSSGAAPGLMIESTDGGAGTAPDIKFHRNSASTADDDYLAAIQTTALNAAEQETIYSEHYTYLTSETDGAERGQFNLKVMSGGTAVRALVVAGTSVASVAYTGIMESVPDNPLHVTGTNGNAVAVLKLEQLDDDEPFIRYQGTTASDQTKSLSTDTSVGALTGHVRVSINGTDFWMPYYATN